MASKVQMEMLERRILLSTATPGVVIVPTPILSQGTPPLQGVVSTPNSLSPQSYDESFGFSDLYFGSATTPGNGAGQTVAIVDAVVPYGLADDYTSLGVTETTVSQNVTAVENLVNPTLVNDVETFDQHWGLSNDDAEGKFFLTIQPLAASATAGGNYSGTIDYINQYYASNGAYPTQTDEEGWAQEMTLDVEWAHAVAPGAHILLVESPSPDLNLTPAQGNGAGDLIEANVYAAAQTGVVDVSNSWGVVDSAVPEPDTYDGYFVTPAGHNDNNYGPDGVYLSTSGTAGVVFFAASGDTGGAIEFPAASISVTPIGGFTWPTDINGEWTGLYAGWADSGGGSDPNYSSPKYNEPLFSMDGDPQTGVWIYYSGYDNPTPWEVIGGTSLATPAWAAYTAIIDQGLALQGVPSLNQDGLLYGDYNYTANTDGNMTAQGGLLYLAEFSLSTREDFVGGANIPDGNANDYPLWPHSNTNPGGPTITLTPGGGSGWGGPNAYNLTNDMVGGTLTTQLDVLSFSPEPPTSATAGQDITAFDVNVETPNGLVDTTYNGNVTISIDPGSVVTNGEPAQDVTLYGTTTVAVANGVADFSTVSIQQAGTYVFDASAPNTIGSVSTGVAVAPGSLNGLSVVPGDQPTSFVQTAAMAAPIAIELVDAYGNTVTTTGTTIDLAINSFSGSGTPVLSGETSETTVNGVATFTGVSANLVGTYTLKAYIPPSGQSVVTNSFNVTAPQLVFIEQPASFILGSTMQTPVEVEFQDLSGNQFDNNGVDVTLAINSGPAGAVLSGQITVASVNGVCTFTGLSVNEAGTYTLIGTENSASTPASNSFSVQTSELVFVQQPSSFLQGDSSAPIEVQFENQSGSVVPTDTTVTLAISSGPAGAVLSGQTSVTSVNGVATFNNVSANLPGTYTLTASSGNGVISVPSASFTVETVQLVFVQQPTSFLQGSAMASPIVVELEDLNGNLFDTSGTEVTLSNFTGPAGAVLSGQTTATAVNGYVTFNSVSANLLGSYTLLAMSSSGTSAVSSSFTVGAAHLAFIEQPSSIWQYTAMSTPVAVAVEDQNDNISTNYRSTPITLSIASGAFGSTLTPIGNITVQTVNGVATFSGLVVNNPGADTLQATAPNLSAADSNPFAVVAVPVRRYSAFSGSPLSYDSLVFQQIRDAQSYMVLPSSFVTGAVLAGDERLAVMLSETGWGSNTLLTTEAAAGDPASPSVAASDSTGSSNADAQVLDSGSGDNNLLD
jgi:hypothetical protein